MKYSLIFFVVFAYFAVIFYILIFRLLLYKNVNYFLKGIFLIN